MALDKQEPLRLATTVQRMNLKHVVITSVDRDDLKDCGSAHFAECIRLTREMNPETTIEVLIPDFKAKEENLERIWKEKPNVINHNVETVPSLYKTICPQSNYEHSLAVLRMSFERGFHAKSGIILGLGETIDEVKMVLKDLYDNGTRLATIGQYLQPTREHAPLKEYIQPEVFQELKEYARSLGFLYVESGPLVRSSYHAGDALENILSHNSENRV